MRFPPLFLPTQTQHAQLQSVSQSAEYLFEEYSWIGLMMMMVSEAWRKGIACWKSSLHNCASNFLYTTAILRFSPTKTTLQNSTRFSNTFFHTFKTNHGLTCLVRLVLIILVAKLVLAHQRTHPRLFTNKSW